MNVATYSSYQVYPDSPPLFTLTPFSHIPTLHLSINNSGIGLNRGAVAGWLDGAVTSVVLRVGMTLQLSLTTLFSPHDRPEWDIFMHGIPISNTTLRLNTRTVYFAPAGLILEHEFVAIDNV